MRDVAAEARIDFAFHLRERLGDAGLLSGELAGEVPRIRRHLTEVGKHVARGSQRVGFARHEP